ncbi:[NiFe] hydrogenase metallocenter assembly protein HypF [Pyrodictium delaneyi]|uniref:Carbamoyltransferase n=1 Tax=Pyrodictium delaneyi TaxID=1273541 RepID=A0A0N7JCV5_9CREN|nr:carbamoyltransferase HypF [Pyrodictium delaneyi]ALL00449.1 [NiFe] hydrogenase metallocenter assembly protein HypF [Pyrodictium delaneyi]OWJ53924.1 carbamoyltransferase HypF [Pyrodictium delaneyi]
MATARRALRLRVTGIVQGVGFRPFIYRLAVSRGLAGYVLNLGGSEVEIYVEGPPDQLASFIKGLYRERPPPARIEELEIEEAEPQGLGSFTIRKSERRKSKRSMIPPDFGICSDCLHEIHDPSTRFYRYYWNSCAWCGPRFSMMYTVPYDRENTAMKKYPLCTECRRDYEDPANLRRFHAQGISCPKCGPRTYVYTMDGKRLDVPDPVEWAAEKIEEGYILAIKGVGGFHLAALATRDDVVEELRRRKRRPSKPFALMARDCSVVEMIAEPPPGACEVLQSAERPILLLPKRPGSPVSELVAPGLDTIGVMLPYTGFQALLLEQVRDGFLIMTSGNETGYPMCTTLKCVFTHLCGIADYVVAHDREIVHRVDDSVLRYTDGELVFLRRARGYAPMWLYAPAELPEMVAVGAELQTAGAVAFEDKVVPTQYIGDMDEPGQVEELERELRWFVEVYSLKPRIVAMDMHPGYHNRGLAARLAEEYGAELVEVQHHHAHAAAAMLEDRVPPGEEKVAITIDGTGYGVDSTIWGGEVLVASYSSFTRVASLYPFRLPGGDAAAKWPVRALIGLMQASGLDEEEALDVLRRYGLLSRDKLPHGETEARVSYRLAAFGKAPLTTSMGRTLDALAALLRIAWRRDYEGEPAMKLEAAARGGRDHGYTPGLLSLDGRLVVDTPGLLRWVLENIDRLPARDIAVTIQRGLGRALGEAAARAARGLDGPVYISGGAAVNTFIVQGARQVLSDYGLEVRIPRRLPPGDGGVAVGQLLVAAAKLGEI